MAAIDGHFCRSIRVPNIPGDCGSRRRFQHTAKHGSVIEHRSLALSHQVQTLLPTSSCGPWLTILLQEVSVERHRLLYSRGVELWLPIRVEPATTKGVDHRIERSHVHAPASLPSQQNAGHTSCRIIELLRELGDLTPRRMQWHGQVMLRENLLVVHHEAALTIERDCVGMSLIGKR